ncbi:MAG: aminomethyl-transferring glycine dehydrogenase subunit GcvPA [Desulfomonile tiedjei]|nr:aminomethyl-transferring glycine dehydrogenase subunit GcvPA [Desulfomonile tiedjei]
MRYLPHTDRDIAEMLDVVAAKDLDDLFATVPAACRRDNELHLSEPLTELELSRHVESLAATMAVSPEYRLFVGAGSYEHFIPESVRYLLGRSEFSTAYTPYQPEMGQGTLQAVYEYQTLVSRLLGMEVTNASLYDGASALAEAVLMAIRVTGRKRVAISRAIHPSYRRVVQTYVQSTDFEVLELPYLPNGRTDLSSVPEMKDLAAVAVQSPNFFGCIEEPKAVGEAAHQGGALFVTAFSEPLAYGLFKNPGSQAADIVCGEGQSFGIPQSFGGPSLGMFATRTQYVRSMPGRLVGQTHDAEGRRAFVLTLATREQHIRREKATSNICTNNSLCALAAAMYLASLGRTGLRELAALNRDKAEYLKKQLTTAGFRVPFDSATFNEFVVEVPAGFDAAYERLLEKRIVAGLPLGRSYPELAGCYLLGVTETRTRADMDDLVRELKS